MFLLLSSISTISNLNGQFSLDKLKIKRACLIQDFEADFLWKVQTPEFRNNPENFHPCIFSNIELDFGEK